MTNNKIKELILYYDSKKDDYTSFVVIREDDTKEKHNDKDNDYMTALENRLSELQADYGVTNLKDLQDRGIVKIQENNKNLFRIKNFVFNKKTLSVLVAGVVLVTGVNYFRKSSNTNTTNNNQSNIETTNNNFDDTYPTVTPDVTPTPTPLPTETIVPNATPFIEPEFDESTLYVPNQPVQEDKTQVIQIATNVNFIDEELQDYVEFENLGLEKQNVMAIELLPEEISFIRTNDDPNFDSSLEGLVSLGREDANKMLMAIMLPENADLSVGNLINYENLFVGNNVDFAFVEYFSKMRNKIAESAFFNQDLKTAREYVKLACSEVIRCIHENQPIAATLSNGQIINICYEDLTHEAKEVIINIAEHFYALLNEDTFEYNGEVMNQRTLEDYIFTEERLSSFTR